MQTSPKQCRMQLPNALVATLLDSWPVGRLATVTAGGDAHGVPIVFCRHEGMIFSPLDSKAKRSARLRRFDNVAHNPAASLLLDHYAADWQQLWWVRIDGPAERYEPGDVEGAAIGARLRSKYPQYTQSGFHFEQTTYLRLRPARIVAWAQSGSVATIQASLPAG